MFISPQTLTLAATHYMIRCFIRESLNMASGSPICCHTLCYFMAWLWYGRYTLVENPAASISTFKVSRSCCPRVVMVM